MTRGEVFATTHPSLIQRLLTNNAPVRDAAWVDFIRRYEEPIAFCAAVFLPPAPAWAPTAEDLTAEFFGHLLLGEVFEKWEPSRGPLRAYVQGVLRRFLAGALRKACPVGQFADDALESFASAEPAVEAQFARRWAYNVFVLALHHVGRSNEQLAWLWLELEGLQFLVVDRTNWKMASYDDATVAAARHDVASPVTAAVVARRAGLAEGTVHNRKYRANTMLLGYLAAELRGSNPGCDVQAEMDQLLLMLEPLIPTLAVLRQRSGGTGNGGGATASSGG